VNSARFITDEQRDQARRHCDPQRVAELHPEVVQIEVLLLKNHLEVLQRGVLRPEAPRGGLVALGDREQEHVINGNNGPQQHRDADQQQLGFGGDILELHLLSRFIMK
jgi:hypothetical protein